jgi:membrane associated rhomboid family serine protease
MEAGGARYTLYADPAFALAIRDEFALYAEEQAIPVARKLEPPIHKSGIELAMLWAITLLFVFLNQSEAVSQRFSNSSHAIFDLGEWWRPFTSLFLHGDFNHLIGNVLIGGIFCVMVAHSIGPLVGWITILASGTLGNLATARYYYPEQFASLGASTATFGALGVLVGSSAYFAWHGRSLRKLGGAVLPIVAGSILLGWFGSGGGSEQVDVLAHVLGFAVGAVLGLVVIILRSRFFANSV